MSKNLIKNIIFDLGGVLLNIDFVLTQKAFSDLGIKNVSEIFGQHQQLGFFDRLDRGEISDAEFYTQIKQLLPKGVSHEQIRNAWNIMLFDFPKERFNLLLNLKNNYRLFLMSNTNSIHFQEYQSIIKNTYNISGLNDLFEKAYYSFQLGKRKPEASFFQLILEENKIKAEESLFIDDTFSNIEAAEKEGIHGFFLQTGIELTTLFEKGQLKDK